MKLFIVQVIGYDIETKLIRAICKILFVCVEEEFSINNSFDVI